MFFTTKENSLLYKVIFEEKKIKLDPDPHLEKLLVPDPQKMNADP